MNHHTFNQRQMDLLLPDILAHLHRLTTHTEQMENALTVMLSSVDRVRSQLREQGPLLYDLHARPSTTTVDRNVLIEVAQEHLLPILRDDMVNTIQTVAATVMTRMLSTPPEEIQALQERQFATIATSTDDLSHTPERVLISSASQTEDTDIIPVSITPHVDTPKVPGNSLETQDLTEIAKDESVSLPVAMESLGIDPGQSFPTSDLRAPDVGVVKDRSVSDQGPTDTETQGVAVCFTVTLSTPLTFAYQE